MIYLQSANPVPADMSNSSSSKGIWHNYYSAPDNILVCAKPECWSTW